MNNYKKISLTLLFFLALSACGQKTPLEVDKPQKVQEEVTEPTV